MGVLGNKARHLEELVKLGMPVPQFVVDPDVESVFSARSYAVRSNAATEDGAQDSQAGQFLTKLDVAPKDLADAIRQVSERAHSAIVQEYIPADYAGVAFTRNPVGGRELIIEYHQGRGEDVVSGKIKPERIAWNRNQPIAKFQNLIELFEKIEAHYGHPQDIEWCTRGGEIFILQTRPITTITEEEYQLYRLLDRELPQFQDFFFEKTAISEIAPRPSSELLNLLKKIYGSGGPVQLVYKKYGIQYIPRDFLRLINSELYVDREEELKTLLPSYSYFPLRDRLQHFKHWSGLLTTMKNLAVLNKLPLTAYDQLYQKITKKLSEPLGEFLQDYELIFETNVLAERALKIQASTLEQFARLRELGRQLTERYFKAMNIGVDSQVVLPNILTSVPLLSDNKKPLGVSPGQATGVLGKDILYVRLLTPDLLEKFSSIRGIVSEQGGMLSHLAILAREHKIPVVVNVNLLRGDLRMGDTIHIDGNTGVVEKLD